MPFVSHLLFKDILDRAIRTGARAVVPESDSTARLEPFCAFYSQRVLEDLDAFLAKGGGSAKSFLASLPDIERIPFADVQRFGDPSRILFSVNTPEDLARARAIADQAQ